MSDKAVREKIITQYTIREERYSMKHQFNILLTEDNPVLSKYPQKSRLCLLTSVVQVSFFIDKASGFVLITN